MTFNTKDNSQQNSYKSAKQNSSKTLELHVRKILKIILPVVVVLFILYEAFGAFFSYTVFKGIKPENSPDSPEFKFATKLRYEGDDPVEILNQQQKDICFPWLKENSQIVSIKSHDNLNLNAFSAKTLKPENHNYAIIMHGYRSNAMSVAYYAKHFYENGFNIIVPGQRGHGWSEGNLVDMSANTHLDVERWIQFICNNDSAAKILIWGISMGGSTVMRTTGLKLPSNVLCCVEDCGFSSMCDEFSHQLKTAYHMPTFPTIKIFNIYAKKHLGINCNQVSAKDELKNSVTPTLFIHGSADTYVPFYMLDIVYNAAACPKQKLVIEGAAHARSAFKNPELYWTTVDEFVGKFF